MASEIVKEFIKTINRQELNKMRALMSDELEFVDAGGVNYIGREEILKGWPEYYEMFPDYTIEMLNTIESNELVAAFGYASANYRNLKDPSGSNYWRIPAAWKAVVRNNLIVYWQVYCDYSPIHEIMQRNNSTF